MKLGLAMLGLPEYAEVGMKHLPKGWGIVVFDSEFGDALPVVTKACGFWRVPWVEVQIGWKNHRISHADFPALAKRAARYAPLAQSFGTQFYISGACEHELKAGDATELKRQVLQAFPACKYVNTPDNKGAIIPDCITEFHGSQARPRAMPCNYNSDGSAIEDLDIEVMKVLFAMAEIFAGWTPTFNLHMETKDPTRNTPPRGEDIDSVVYIMSNTRGPVKLPEHFLWKSHGEYQIDSHTHHPTPASNKVCLIAPVHGHVATLRQGGHVLHTLPYFSPYTDGRSKFYGTEWGYKLSIAAKNQPCELWIDNKRYGHVNPAFRYSSSGEYHV